MPLNGHPLLVGVESDPELVRCALKTVKGDMERRGWTVAREANRLEGRKADKRIEIFIRQRDIMELSAGSLPSETFHGLTAQAFMDIVPIDSVLSLTQPLLTEPGFIYATLNYEATTTLFPPWPDEPFERSLLAAYDQSMEKRAVDGQKTGGAMTGRRLYSLLQKRGYRIIGLGNSDWNTFPFEGNYTESEAHFLRTLMTLIRKEGMRAEHLDDRAIETWYRARLREIDSSDLSVIIHQVDILATLVS
jgi:hypothetical protein